MKSNSLKILEQYDRIQDQAQVKEYAYKRMVLTLLLEGCEVLNDIRDQLVGSSPASPETSEKEAEKKSPPPERPVQKKVEGQKYDPNGPPSEKQWWRLDEIKKQVSENRWREFLDDVSVTIETQLTLTKAGKIIEQVVKRKE